MLKEQFLGQLSVELCCVGLEQGRMEKKCGFCGDTRPLVYCKADAASLCLACDVRIHAANALFRRHIRALLCQACGAKPASIRCLDHSNVVCQGCDRKLHGASVQHRKCVISSYTGCPSAKEFASLWGFGLKELSNNGGSASFGSAILDVANEGVHEASNVCSSSNTMDRKASSSNLPSWTKPKNQSKQLHKTALHQSLDMQRFQHHKTKNLSLIPDQIKAEELKIRAGELKVIKQHSEESQAFVNAELKQGDNKHPELQGPHFPPPVFHSDNMNLISNDDVHFHGDPFWPSNHPTQDNQFWYQTSLDLGFYEDINCYDGLSIPDFGPTFPDYEELFDGDNCQTQSMQSGIDSACSSIACDTSIAKSDFDHPTSTEALQPSSHCKDQPDNCFLSGGFTDDYSAPTKGASSSSSITFSSYSAEISTFKYPSSSVSSNATKRDLQRKFTEAGNGAHLEFNAIKKNKKA